MPDRLTAGASIYNRATLALYDLAVLRLSNALVWRVPTASLLALYDAQVSANHLDVGPGSGYFLDRCRFPAKPALALLDENPAALAYTAKRLTRYAPTLHRADILGKLPATLGSYDSIALNYVLHCLPGTLAAKQPVLERLREHLNAGGRMFGATILGGGGAHHTRIGRGLLEFYNRRGIFGNESDSLAELHGILSATFARYSLTQSGAVALFACFAEIAPNSPR